MDLQFYRELENRLNYIHKMKPLLSKEALHSDESEYYQFPSGASAGDRVTVRLRTKKSNADAVYLISGSLRKEMFVAMTKDGFDY